MKTLIYQYWTGSEPKESALIGSKAMKEYADRIGADYYFSVNEPFFGGPKNWKYLSIKGLVNEEKQIPKVVLQKYNALRPIWDDNFLQYDKILYVDLDIFPLKDCNQNIFEEEVKHFGICEETHMPKLRKEGLSGVDYINTDNDLYVSNAVYLVHKNHLLTNKNNLPRILREDDESTELKTKYKSK